MAIHRNNIVSDGYYARMVFVAATDVAVGIDRVTEIYA